MDALIRATNTVTVLHAVPSLMRQWLEALSGEGSRAHYPALRLLLVGGESVPQGLLVQINQWRPAVRLLALYGMTESTIVCSSHEARLATSAHYCIGRPYPHASFHILNSRGQTQPIGVPGELYIGGASIAQGYINQPGMTNERFQIFPLYGDERLYRTGDRARCLEDGNFEFLGRVDHQVSLRGARIELAEIEMLAGAVDGVVQTVAHVVPIGLDEQTLVLFYTSNRDIASRSELAVSLRTYLASHLPDYMRPTIIQFLERLPLNPNGKVDRNQLPAPKVAETIIEPASDVEARLLLICQTLLQRDDFGVTGDFFELGGHSLLAAKLVTRIRTTFSISFPLSALYATPTVRGCAALVETAIKESYAENFEYANDPKQAYEDLIL
jgi:acyl-CoA synthetase (AMP-forming)/AMP-acid ligase II/acyl carrier protein